MRIITVALGLSLASGLVLTHPAAAQVDRYGGARTVRPAEAAPAAHPARPGVAPGRTLSWPGKGAAPQAPAQVRTVPAAYSPPPAPPPQPAYVAPASYSAPAPAPVAPPAPQPAARAARDDGFVPLYAPAASAPPAPPASIYAPAPPQAAAPPAPVARPVQQASAQRSDGPRFYSVHRDFGIAPDAAPIPPAFFTATADLSEPPQDEGRERRIITGADGQRTTVIRRASSSGAN